MTEQLIRDALRSVAEAGGAPDVDAAWDDVRRDIAAASKARSLRLVLGGAALAIAGAAAAVVVVVSMGPDHEVVQVGPSGEPSTTLPAPTTTEGQVDDPLVYAMPEHPMGVVVDVGGGQRLDLYDADTGELLQRGLTESAFSIASVSFSMENGLLVYTEELGDTSRVRLMSWDRDQTPVTPVGDIFDTETRGGVFSPDGTTLAFVEQGVTKPTGRIGFADPATGAVTRYLEWAPGEEDPFLTNGRIDDLMFSPDGTRLAFVSSYEGEDVRIVDVDAASLSESRSLGVGATDPAWIDDRTILAVEFCCYPEFDQQGARLVISVDEPSGDPDEVADDAISVAVRDGIVAVVSADGALEVDGRSIAVDGTALDVGL